MNNTVNEKIQLIRGPLLPARNNDRIPIKKHIRKTILPIFLFDILYNDIDDNDNRAAYPPKDRVDWWEFNEILPLSPHVTNKVLVQRITNNKAIRDNTFFQFILWKDNAKANDGNNWTPKANIKYIRLTPIDHFEESPAK